MYAATGWNYGNEKILEIERGSTRTHTLENSLRQRLWTFRMTEYGLIPHTTNLKRSQNTAADYAIFSFTELHSEISDSYLLSYKNHMFWDVVTSSLVHWYLCFRDTYDGDFPPKRWYLTNKPRCIHPIEA